MNDQSPPKRVTRARAAAKTTDTGVKIATAASKAKVNRTASTTKRKTRAGDALHDDNEDEIIEPELPTATRGRPRKVASVQEDEEQHESKNEIIEPEIPKPTRGRPKKSAVVQPDPKADMEEDAPAPAKPTRGRPKKAVVEAPAPEPTRSTRGRAKKVEVPEGEAIIAVEEPPKKPTRARTATVSKATAPKKAVTFEEPDKENIMPPPANAKGKAKVTEVGTGLRAKPVRKPANTTARATRGRSKVEEKEQKSSPLSPKKATQVGAPKEVASDDELATNEKTPMKPLMKSPIRAPGSVLGSTKRLDFSTSITVHRAVGLDFSGSTMASPARRPLQSPFKESMKASPQRSNFGGSLMMSPLRLPLPQPEQAQSESSSNFKVSLLQSPARRPQSPTKVSEHGSPSRSQKSNPMIGGATPQKSTFKISRFGTPSTLTKAAMRPGQMLPPSAFKNVSTGSPQAKQDGSIPNELSAPSLSFSGRLSSIMPREADPTHITSESIVEESEDQSTIKVEQPGQPIGTVEMEQPIDEFMADRSTTPDCLPPSNISGAFALREVDENPFVDSESEDELASVSPKYSPGPSNPFGSSPATPTPFAALSMTPKMTTAQKSSSKNRMHRQSQIGFTPLAKQLNDWMASSPDKSEPSDSDKDSASPTGSTPRATLTAEAQVAARSSPAKTTFFEDEMSIRDEMVSGPDPEHVDDMIIDEQNFTPIDVVEEDLALAEEADEMSMLEAGGIEDLEETQEAIDMLINTEEAVFDSFQQQVDEISQMPIESSQDHSEFAQVETMVMIDKTPVLMKDAALESFEDSHEAVNEPALSEASQEYGDENAILIDPILLALPCLSTPVLKTPKRILAERVCHTVSKVPLKAAAEESPMRPSSMKRSATVSRLPAPRPSSNITRSNTVISYSPTKSTFRADSEQEDVVMEDACATPSKPETELWSNMATPARTPRRDLNTALLKGAVVFVDVHTSEGADASSLFTELLTQMGARCVKSWNWNLSSDDDSKIGITHVVFKDGGKRTLEKVKETDGVVACVGVGWVLDCERENKWIPESPYSVDTAMVPRGGHRRRKSMEPRTFANLNGTLLPSTSTTPARKSMSPMKNPNSFADTPLTSKSRRRDSVQWVRSPSSASSANDEKLDDRTLMLSPVPATPAPEAISAYGVYGDETPSAQTPYFLKNDQLLQQTAPVTKFSDFGEERTGMGRGLLSEKKDESVVMRLMAARRKSLQWAPKVGSPLARGGQ